MKGGAIVSFVALATMDPLLADPMPVQPFGRLPMLLQQADRENPTLQGRRFRVRAEHADRAKAAKRGHRIRRVRLWHTAN
jgi:hypothetical protein